MVATVPAIGNYALTNPNNAAVQYAESYWSWCWWYSATDSTDPNGCTSTGSQSGKSECAEFVARSLAAEGLIPGLSPSSDQSLYANYTYPANNRVYALWNVGTNTINGLYQFIIDSGIGVPVGDNPAAAVPGDPVFYYSGPPASDGSNRAHTALLVATGTTPGGNDTLIDEHNDPGWHWYYASVNLSGRVIVHITANGKPATSASKPVVIKDTPNQPEVFALSSSGHIMHAALINSTSWTSWLQIGDSTLLASNPALLNNGQIYARSASDNQIRQTYWTGSAWSGWNVISNFGPGFLGDPVVIPSSGTADPNYPEVFATGLDGHVYHTWVQNGAWLSWMQIGDGTAIAGTPAMLNNGKIYARSAGDNQIRQTYWTGSAWSAWTVIGGTLSGGFQSDPIVETSGSPADPNYPIVYATGANGQVYRTYVQNGAWLNWQPVGDATPIESTQAMLNNGTIYARSLGDNQIRQTYYNGNPWSAWSVIQAYSGGFVGNPYAVAPIAGDDPNYPEIFAIGADGHIESTDVQTGAWQPWSLVGDNTVTFA